MQEETVPMNMSPVMNAKNNAKPFRLFWSIECLIFISLVVLSSKIGTSRDKVKKLSQVKLKVS